MPADDPNTAPSGDAQSAHSQLLRKQSSGALLQRSNSEMAWDAKDTGVVAWFQRIRSYVFARPSETVLTEPMDLTIMAGPLDIAMIPNRDTVRGENALVFQIQRFDYSSCLECTQVPCVGAHGQGVAVVLAEFPLGPPDGDLHLLPPSILDYNLSYKVQGGVATPQTSVALQGQHAPHVAAQVTCAQLVWVAGLIGKFSAVMRAHKPPEKNLATSPRQSEPLERVMDNERVTGAVEHPGNMCMASSAEFVFARSHLSFTLHTFSKVPIVQVAMGDFTVSDNLAGNLHILTAQGLVSVTSQVSSNMSGNRF